MKQINLFELSIITLLATILVQITYLFSTLNIQLWLFEIQIAYV